MLNDLSNDQRLLYEYVIGIGKGHVSDRFASYKIGPANHARWLTLALRVMSIYIRGGSSVGMEHDITADDAVLAKLVGFICQVYAPSWFSIKKDKLFQNQALYIFDQIQAVKKQPEDIKKAALKNIQGCCWPLLPENVLFFMVASKDLNIRHKGTAKILSLRAAGSAEKERTKSKASRRILQMSHLKINFDALNWWELINLDEDGVKECPMTLSLSDEQIEFAHLWGHPLDIPLDLPSHSQSVERSVKLVTEASEQVYGFENRHKFIKSVVLSRKARSMFDNKSAYVESYSSYV